MTAHIRGEAITGFAGWLCDTHDARALQTLVDRAGPEAGGRLNVNHPQLGLQPSVWYESSFVGRLLDVIVEGMTHEARFKLAQTASSVIVPRQLGGPQRFAMARLANPALYGRHIQFLWRRLHDTGERSARIVDAGRMDSQIASWDGHHVFLCEAVHATMLELFRAMGYSQLDARREACVSEGAAKCQWTVAFAR